MNARGLSRATIRRRRLTLSRFRAWLDENRGGIKIEQATSGDVERWLDQLEVAPQSRHYYAQDLSAWYRWAIRSGLAATNPLEGREKERLPKRLPRPIATSDLSHALEQADPRMRQMLVLAAFAGLRAGEIAGLDAADIDRERGMLIIRGKGAKDRAVPMHPFVLEVTQNIRRGPVVARKRGSGYLAPNTVTILVADFLRDNGIDKTCHPLRHWFASTALKETGNLRAVQELLGHEDPKTTAVYTLVEDEQKAAAVASLSLAG